MNKQIKEILNNSGLDIRHDGIILTKNITGAEGLQQFAELIVRECVQQISNRWKNDNRIKTEIERREANSCIKDIKDHFGVKE